MDGNEISVNVLDFGFSGSTQGIDPNISFDSSNNKIDMTPGVHDSGGLASLVFDEDFLSAEKTSEALSRCKKSPEELEKELREANAHIRELNRSGFEKFVRKAAKSVAKGVYCVGKEAVKEAGNFIYSDMVNVVFQNHLSEISEALTENEYDDYSLCWFLEGKIHHKGGEEDPYNDKDLLWFSAGKAFAREHSFTFRGDLLSDYGFNDVYDTIRNS